LKQFKETVIKALLPQIILQELSVGGMHGYALISLIRRKHGVWLHASTVYPALVKMEKQGLIQGAWQVGSRARKVYVITNNGRKLLAQNSQVLGVMMVEVKQSA
jgi:DNA-binding PadR family transcriptional regulator